MSLKPGRSPWYVARIRKRDGDHCWLCRGLIDFDLDPNDQMAKSLDHVKPRAAGGRTVLSNLRLAHRLCNVRRGSPIAWDDWSACRPARGGMVIGDKPVLPCLQLFLLSWAGQHPAPGGSEMARLPSERYVIQQIDGSVVLFEDGSEREIVRFNPADTNAAAQAQATIHESDLSDEDKAFAHFWSGYFYAHATGPAAEES